MIQEAAPILLKKYAQEFGNELTIANEAHKKEFGREMNEVELAALGKYLHTWDITQKIMESDQTSRNNLGPLPRISLGIVALQYATLPANFLASVQPIEEEVGVVYYRDVVATKSRGAVAAGDVLGNEAGGLTDINALDSYYGERTKTETAFDTTSTSYDISLQPPVRPDTIEIKVVDNTGAVKREGVVNHEGKVFGTGFSGNVNFDSGVLHLDFSDTSGLANTDKIVVDYDQNLVQADEVPGFKWIVRSRPVRAHYHIIQTSYSLLSEISLKRRFGRMLEQDVVSDIIGQINGAVLGRIIRELRAATDTYPEVQWDATLPPGVSAVEHRLTFNDALDLAAQQIDQATGAGGITALVVGGKGRVVLRSIGMEIEAKKVTGPFFLGYYNGIPVVYAPTNVLASDEVLAVFRGSNWLDSPVVYAPYLPVTVARGVTGPNVLNQATAAAHAAAVTRVVDKFAVRIRITNM